MEDVEEELLIRIYKDNAEQLRKKGKRGPFLPRNLLRSAEKWGNFSTAPVLKLKRSFFNLSKNYKQVKVKTRFWERVANQ